MKIGFLAFTFAWEAGLPFRPFQEGIYALKLSIPRESPWRHLTTTRRHMKNLRRKHSTKGSP